MARVLAVFRVSWGRESGWPQPSGLGENKDAVGALLPHPSGGIRPQQKGWSFLVAGFGGLMDLAVES